MQRVNIITVRRRKRRSRIYAYTPPLARGDSGLTKNVIKYGKEESVVK